MDARRDDEKGNGLALGSPRLDSARLVLELGLGEAESETDLGIRNTNANPGARAGIDLNVLDAHFHFHRPPISVAQRLASLERS